MANVTPFVRGETAIGTPGQLSAGFTLAGAGAVTDLYAVRGLNGAGGPTGVRRLQFPASTSWLSQAGSLRPPLRIATLPPRVLPPVMDGGLRAARG